MVVGESACVAELCGERVTVTETLAQPVGSGHDHRLELVDRPGAVQRGGVIDDLQSADRLDRPVMGVTPPCEDGGVDSGGTHGSAGAGIDEVLRDVDVAVLLRHVTDRLLEVSAEGGDGLDDAELHQTVVQVHRERSRLAVAFAELLAEWDTRRIWESDGSRSPAHRLARETRSSVGAARDDLRRARRIRHLPLGREAVAAGVLSIDHLDLLGHVNTPERRHLFARDEALLVRKCAGLSLRRRRPCRALLGRSRR